VTTAREDAEGEDAFDRGFHGIPSDTELRAMSYVALCELLSSCAVGTTKHAIVAREKERRDAVENAGALPAEKRWFERPVGIVTLGIVASIVASAVWYLLWRN